jgi:3-methyladenine DNA glycosylase AlkD
MEHKSMEWKWKEAAVLAKEIQSAIRKLPRPSTQPIRALRRQYSKRLSAESPASIVQISNHLVDAGSIKCRFFAYELILHHLAALQSLRGKDLEQLGRGMSSWAEVDTFSCYVSGPVWRACQVQDSLIHRWARSRDRWWRRAALVSTVPLNNKARGGTGDTRRTLEVCRILAADHDDMVEKALSWALRELSKRDPDAVSLFLERHEKKLGTRVLREVRNKLSTGLKNPKKSPTRAG